MLKTRPNNTFPKIAQNKLHFNQNPKKKKNYNDEAIHILSAEKCLVDGTGISAFQEV